MNNERSHLSMLLLSAVCAVLVVLLAYSMPHGSPRQEPDGSIAITAMYSYDQQGWKIYPIFGFGIAAPVFLALGCRRLFRTSEDKKPQVTADQQVTFGQTAKPWAGLIVGIRSETAAEAVFRDHTRDEEVLQILAATGFCSAAGHLESAEGLALD